MDILLGVDAGATKTVALLTDRGGHILGRGQGGPGNIHSVGERLARESIQAAIAAAFAHARRPRKPGTTMCIGLAGAGQRAEAEAWERWCLEQGFARRVRATSDAELVLAAALADQRGIVVIAGTGSIAFAQGVDGQRTRAGGWGYIIGDEGSAYDIASQALNAVLKAFDGRGPQTVLTPAILAACHVEQPPGLIGYVYDLGVNRHALARLAVEVNQAAEKGDVVARTILDHAGEELAELAAAAGQSAGLKGRVRCGLAGGVLIHSQRIRDRLVAQMTEHEFVVDPLILVDEPAQGAIRLAISLAQET